MDIKKLAKKKLKRSKNSHKGDFGRIFILAGSKGMSGAAHLSALGALRSGAGLVTLGVPEKIYKIVARKNSEIMVHPFPSTFQGTLSLKGFPKIKSFYNSQNVLAIGPGLSKNSSTQKLIHMILKNITIPVVIDADGLNALKGNLNLLLTLKNRAVLTPHTGEFLRVFRGKSNDSDLIRKKRALEVAKKFKITIILKGNRTVVASPSGEVFLNTTGNPGMATAGSGDVLTGILTGLLGQGLSLFEAACIGVYVHGLAGDLAKKKKGEISLIAGDLIDNLPIAFRVIMR